ncbi:MAG: hydratase, partial [Pyramidobacter sp.]|nr:hydratase [Pyramidobacter sp.]
MVTLIDNPVYLLGGTELVAKGSPRLGAPLPAVPGEGTMTRRIMDAHSADRGDGLYHITFDSLTSHDITYVGVLQTAVACGLEKFPVPFVMTNCHNSLCAVGGTINEDDHMFGLSAARKFGGIFVPRHEAVMHQYMREMMAVSGGMILGTDSHTRYGGLGTLSVGEGGPEMVKQLLGRTYDLPWPGVTAVYLKGAPRAGVGPHDVALAIIGAVFARGFVKNRSMEFVGPGVSNLSAEFRMGVDVMTTETACWSSVWRTDGVIKEYLASHGRADAYRQLDPSDAALYDNAVVVDLDTIEPMIALPFHPSNVYTIAEFCANPGDILRAVEKDAATKMDNPDLRFCLTDKLDGGKFRADQGIIAGCAGGSYENLAAAAQILDGQNTGCGAFSLSVYPSSQPVNLELMKNGCMARLLSAGAVSYPAFCGPCFGAGETPCNGGFSVRHTTRNFPNREGSKPNSGQIAGVALMDARSIAATAANGGVITSAFEYADRLSPVSPCGFEDSVYDRRVYSGFGRPQPDAELQFGPNIKPWPVIQPLADNQLLLVASVITDAVTTTDELIPSG